MADKHDAHDFGKQHDAAKHDAPKPGAKKDAPESGDKDYDPTTRPGYQEYPKVVNGVTVDSKEAEARVKAGKPATDPDEPGGAPPEKVLKAR